MEKRGILFLLICIFLFTISISAVYAHQEDGENITEGEAVIEGGIPDEKFDDPFDDPFEDNELLEDYEDAELEQDAGTTPGSAFYFIDKFFDRFGDKLDVKEERIAEIKAMVEAGDLESAKIALKEYMELADELEHEIEPERKEDALRSAAAIRSAMKDIRDELPPGERGEFVRDIMRKENSIATAAEISSKIKELCVQLAELDPMEYSRMCKTDEDAPKWQKKLDRDLSAEQEEIARAFVETMKQCFKTSGQDCACEDIPFYDFSVACSKAAPLATACDIDGDEIACDELENLEMPDLPEWLEPIWEDLEMGMMEAQYDMHMPPECVKAGVTAPKECGKIMIKAHAPLECKAALLEADVQSEREGREICDKIMMEQHAPECAEKGITSPEECARYMDSFREEGRMMEGPGLGRDCGRIEDPMERLECYDNKGNKMRDHYGLRGGEMPEGEITWQCKEHRIHWPPDCEKFMREELPKIERQRMEEGDRRRANEEDWRVKEKECAASCDLENGWWDFRDGECVCYATEGTGPQPGEWGGEGWEGGSGCDDCSSQCPESVYTDCVNDACVCGEVPGEPGDYAGTEGGSGEGEEGSGAGGGGEGSGESTTESSGSESESSGGGSESTVDGEGEGGEGITGGVIFENAFLDYYFG